MNSAIVFHDGDSPDTYALMQNDDLERTTRALSRLVEDGAALNLDIVGDHHQRDLVFDDRGFLCDVDLPGGLERVYVLDRSKTCNIFISTFQAGGPSIQ